MYYQVIVCYALRKYNGEAAKAYTTISMDAKNAIQVLRGERSSVSTLVRNLARLQGYAYGQFRTAELDQVQHPGVTLDDIIALDRGWRITSVGSIPGASYIKREAKAGKYDSDKAAAAAAEEAGVKLVHGLPVSENDAGFGYYVDTLDNQKCLSKYFQGRGFEWPPLSDGIYLRVGTYEVPMDDVLECLAVSMGIEKFERCEVALGRNIPDGKVEAIMDYFQPKNLNDRDPYPGVDIMLRRDGEDPIQMVHVSQGVEEDTEEKVPHTYIYHRGKEVAAVMPMPIVMDEENEVATKLVICGGDPGAPLHVHFDEQTVTRTVIHLPGGRTERY